MPCIISSLPFKRAFRLDERVAELRRGNDHALLRLTAQLDPATTRWKNAVVVNWTIGWWTRRRHLWQYEHVDATELMVHRCILMFVTWFGGKTQCSLWLAIEERWSTTSTNLCDIYSSHSEAQRQHSYCMPRIAFGCEIFSNAHSKCLRRKRWGASSSTGK